MITTAEALGPVRGRRVATAESVTEGHPDKVCDYIGDSILDAHLARDAMARVACEVLAKNDTVVLAGEITSLAQVDSEAIVRQAVREVGYTDEEQPFAANTVKVISILTQQAPEIAQGVDGHGPGELGAGDQGIMVGYATDETPDLMPLPILLAHRLAHGLAEDRRSCAAPWLRPDGKTQVSVAYENDVPREVTDVVVSAQHAPDVDQETVRAYALERLLPRVLRERMADSIRVHVNTTGSFVHGGPSVDCGLTGRKLLVHTYGCAAAHGGGSFSGKDPTKVDRSAAYFCRYVARQLVLEGLAKRVEVQVAYVIGEPQPVALSVDTFGTGDRGTAEEFVGRFDFRPAAIIERLGLRRPIYRQTTNYGHFGRAGLPWEQ